MKVSLFEKYLDKNLLVVFAGTNYNTKVKLVGIDINNSVLVIENRWSETGTSLLDPSCIMEFCQEKIEAPSHDEQFEVKERKKVIFFDSVDKKNSKKE